jgi:hypothetical protein
MTRAGISTCIIASALLSASVGATRAASKTDVIVATNQAVTSEISAQSRRVVRRTPSRVRIYRSPGPGPNAVRVCNAYYEQEYRLSGTVIVPRMHCYWRG